MKQYYAEVNGKRIIVKEKPEVRYNSRTTGTPKSVRKGQSSGKKMLITALTILAVASFLGLLNIADEQLLQESGVEVIESYSPSGGPTRDINGELNYDTLDVVGRAFEIVGEKIIEFGEIIADITDSPNMKG